MPGRKYKRGFTAKNKRGDRVENALRFVFEGLSRADINATRDNFYRAVTREVARHRHAFVRFLVQVTAQYMAKRYARKSDPAQLQANQHGNYTYWTTLEPVASAADARAILNELFFGSEEERDDEDFDDAHREIVILQAEVSW